MNPDWKEDQPIYRQLRDKVASAILEGSLKEGEALPSVRNVAMEMQINPLTASKAYQELVSQELVEKRRGLGMFVIEGARAKLLQGERKRFLEEEWPEIVARIQALEMDIDDLVKGTGGSKNRKKS
ncbi:MAG: GntR family transcriptional regulator [Proteobacteria bacterium]|nr:GntR family transcriptional regulator [Pseudomonadota bacterium]